MMQRSQKDEGLLLQGVAGAEGGDVGGVGGDVEGEAGVGRTLWNITSHRWKPLTLVQILRGTAILQGPAHSRQIQERQRRIQRGLLIGRMRANMWLGA